MLLQQVPAVQHLINKIVTFWAFSVPVIKPSRSSSPMVIVQSAFSKITRTFVIKNKPFSVQPGCTVLIHTVVIKANRAISFLGIDKPARLFPRGILHFERVSAFDLLDYRCPILKGRNHLLKNVDYMWGDGSSTPSSYKIQSPQMYFQ